MRWRSLLAIDCLLASGCAQVSRGVNLHLWGGMDWEQRWCQTSHFLRGDPTGYGEGPCESLQ